MHLPTDIKYEYVSSQELPLLDLSSNSPLSFPLTLTDGKTIATVGDAADYLSSLNPDQREKSCWRIAIRMLNNALQEPSYLKAATMSFQTALVLDGILASPHPLDNH
jgi:hypothetical protein